MESLRTFHSYGVCPRFIGLMRWLTFTLFLVCPLLFAVASDPSGQLENLGFTLLQGAPIDFELPNLEGRKETLRNYRGKWIWLAFWATWCGPCNEEIPALDALYRQYKKQTNEYLAALLKLNLEIDETAGTKNPTVASLLEKLKFGGISLSDAELTSFEKKIERAIKEST